jgi:hypothetical protein
MKKKKRGWNGTSKGKGEMRRKLRNLNEFIRGRELKKETKRRMGWNRDMERLNEGQCSRCSRGLNECAHSWADKQWELSSVCRC